MSRNTPSPRRVGGIVAAAFAIVAVAVLTLGPGAFVAPARGAFERVLDAAAAPLLQGIPYGDARLLNAALFVPLGAAVAMVLGRRQWILAILVGFAVSAAVEYAQRAIPGRVPDPEDVFWNTLGAAIGVFAVVVVRLIAGVGARRPQGATDAVTGSVTRT
jgi:hypothetical protein